MAKINPGFQIAVANGNHRSLSPKLLAALSKSYADREPKLSALLTYFDLESAKTDLIDQQDLSDLLIREEQYFGPRHSETLLQWVRSGDIGGYSIQRYETATHYLLIQLRGGREQAHTNEDLIEAT